MKERTLTENIAAFLDTALDGHGVAVGANDSLVLSVDSHHYEHHLTQLYLQLLKVVEQQFPERNEDINLLFRTNDGSEQQVFHLRRSVLTKKAKGV